MAKTKVVTTITKGISADRIKNDPLFERTRENASEFGRAGKAAKFTRVVFREMLVHAKDTITYGIVDSLIHIEKGSKVTTRNLVYDGETGDVLVSQTNNEFDDPVYNLHYPAHWAYEGMGPAYKNIGTTVSNTKAKLGRVYYNNGTQPFPMDRYFKTGDELLLHINQKRWLFTNDSCNSNFFSYQNDPSYLKAWVVDASRAIEGHAGLQLIDAWGHLVSGDILTAKVIRSGRRNMSSASVASVTSMTSPIKRVGSVDRIAFDSTAKVIAASAARFKDVWKIDSLLYRKDTVMRLDVPAELDSTRLFPVKSYSLGWQGYPSGKTFDKLPDHPYFEAWSEDRGGGGWDGNYKSWLRFDFNPLPQNAVVTDARLYLYGWYERQHHNYRTSNASYIKRTTGNWITDDLTSNPANENFVLTAYFNETGLGSVETTGMATISATPHNDSTLRNDTVNLTTMVGRMAYGFRYLNQAPAIVMGLVNPTGTTGINVWSRRTYSSGIDFPCKTCDPVIRVKYYKPCYNGSSPIYLYNAAPGYYCVSAPVDTFVCRPIIDSITNPYHWGIWGNWKVDRAYTYYDQRQQADITNETNIRTDGAIKDFRSFWSFTDSLLHPEADNSRWVWNSEITQLNSKGYERENHDPLNRYNSGQYGYNRTLPVAVTQNSKARNAAFDGFEDYEFRTDTCKTCVQPRFVDLKNGGKLDKNVSHTGQYSLRIDGNSTGTTIVPITTVAQDVTEPKISMRIDSIPIVTRTVSPNGDGLNTKLWMRGWSDNNDCANYNNTTDSFPLPKSNINGVGNHFGICPESVYDLIWTGFIQPEYSEVYTFYADVDDRMKIWVNGRQISLGKDMEAGPTYGVYKPTDTISLVAGELYPIRVQYSEDFGAEFYHLKWGSASLTPVIVPVSALYSTLAQGNGTVHIDTNWCVKPRAPIPMNVALEKFSPLLGTKLQVSAWVKEAAACVNGNYVNNSFELVFNDASLTTYVLKPKGPVIEGWQRIEGTIDVPGLATQATVRLRASSATPVYFDDIRFHPFHANMKSFVYNPVNIRLMAELDENNYATFYEYDDDGTLIRVKKETERGIKTIKETRSALLKN